MPNAVYDDQRQASSPIRPDGIKPSQGDEEARQAANADEDRRISHAAAQIRAQERNASSGGLASTSAAGGASAAAAVASSGGASSTAAGPALAQQEAGASAPAAAAAAAGAKASGQKTGWKSLSMRKRFLISGSAAVLIFGAAGGTTFSTLQGPLQLIHAGELLAKFHFGPKNGQSSSRAIKALRQLKNYANKTQYKNNMGWLGNKLADRLETKFNGAGIESEYAGGKTFSGYRIDPARLKGTDFDSLADKSPENVQKYLRDQYGIETRIEGTTLFADGQGLSYSQERQLMRSTLRLAGYEGMTGALGTRIMGARNLIGFHRFKRLERRVNQTLAERFKAWGDELRDYVRNGASPVKPTNVDTEKNKNGKPTTDAEAGANTVNELTQEAADASAKAGTGDPNATASLKENINNILDGKTGKGLNIIGLACLAYYIFTHLDEINKANVILPMMRIAMDTLSKGSQVEAGQDLSEEVAGFQTKLLFDNTKGNESSWSDAMSIKHELGQPLTGKDIPKEAKIDPSGNPVAKIASQIPGLPTACKIVTNTVVAGAITIALVLASDTPFTTFISLAVQGIGGALFADWIAKMLAAAVIDPNTAGVDRGNYMNYGARLAARDQALANGALPITETEHNNQKYAEAKIEEDDFRHQDLAYRLFNPEDSSSLLAQVIDKQVPSPTANIARLGSGILDIGHSLSALASLPFNKVAYAAGGDGYDYGFPDYSFTTAEMNDSKYADPFDNADKASDILDQNEKDFPRSSNATNVDNYVIRAKVCFGVQLEKRTVDGQQLWAVTPPVPGSMPLQSDLMDTKNKCINDAKTKADFDRIRFFIFDSNTMNALACYESTGDDKDETVRKALTQSCIDTGQEPNPVAPTSDTAGGSAAGGASGAANNSPGKLDLTNWKLTIPIGAKEITQPELATYSDDWYHPAADGSGQEFYVDSGAPGVGTTANSKNPRSELREMTGGGKTEASWSSSGPATMLIKQKVTELDGGRNVVVVGQIHDQKDDITVFRLEGTQLWVTKGNTPHGHLVGTVTIGQPFTVGFKVENNVISYYYSPTGDANPPLIDYTYPATFSGAYFKAGNYYQGGTDGGKSRVVIMGLGVTHDGTLPNIAGGAASNAAPTTAAGSSVGTTGSPSAGPRSVPADGSAAPKSTAPAATPTTEPDLTLGSDVPGGATTTSTLPDGTLDLRPPGDNNSKLVDAGTAAGNKVDTGGQVIR